MGATEPGQNPDRDHLWVKSLPGPASPLWWNHAWSSTLVLMPPYVRMSEEWSPRACTTIVIMARPRWAGGNYMLICRFPHGLLRWHVLQVLSLCSLRFSKSVTTIETIVQENLWPPFHTSPLSMEVIHVDSLRTTGSYKVVSADLCHSFTCSLP